MTIIKQGRGLTEGLGGESLVPSGTVYQDTTEQFHPYFIGSITAAREVVSLTSISGPLIFGTTGSYNSIRTAGSVIDTQGRFISVLIGSATTNVWSGFIQTGSLTTSAGSVGFIKLGTSFAGGSNFYAVITPCGSEQGYTESYISGVKHTSGVNIIGGPSLRYDWIAIGI